ncbi:putative DNA ligase-like protein [Sporotomaculum syntrophicum]|uniref:DNA ligase-like protein n=1 Tax=Sporotomaculum syntrophicum TaxID=182264 RepID=A0A9D2WRS1_9FIRM|nr:ATP-dependent DNA ligase [Sporotomaculum syntrophicum]KAF1086179.1 putative DNA ligase-like protein [Sporotomaculum syntrophicum]
MLFTRIKPMLALKGEAPFDDDQYIFELKADGIRLILHAKFGSGRVELYTKTGNRITDRFPEFHGLSLPGVDNIILDGELVIMNNSRPDFTRVMRRFSANPNQAGQLAGQLPATMVVFDILQLNGQKLPGLPLLERKSLLEKTVADGPLLTKNIYVEGQGTLLFNQVVDRRLEGIIAKPKDSLYYPGRRKLWQKIKNYYYRDMDVLGYSPGSGQLLVGENGRPLARVLGLRPVDRAAIARLLPQISTGQKGDTVYIEEGIRCRVRYTVGAVDNIRECVFDSWKLTTKSYPNDTLHTVTGERA